MHIKRRSVVVILSSLLVCAANGCGMRSNLDEGDSIEEITAASAMDSGTKATDKSEVEAEESYCGDGRLDLHNGEQCDGTNLGYASCESLGHGIGTLRCSPACYFDVSNCYTPPPTTPVTPPTDDRTTPVSDDDSNGYGTNPFSDIISNWLDRNRDTATDTTDNQRFGGRNTGN